MRALAPGALRRLRRRQEVQFPQLGSKRRIEIACRFQFQCPGRLEFRGVTRQQAEQFGKVGELVQRAERLPAQLDGPAPGTKFSGHRHVRLIQHAAQFRDGAHQSMVGTQSKGGIHIRARIFRGNAGLGRGCRR